MQKVSAWILVIMYVAIVGFAIYFCNISINYPKKYSDEIKYVCSKFDIPLHTFYALVNTESGFNPNAKSRAGAIGLTQILPSTAEYICIKNNLEFSNYDLYNPLDNLYLGAMYLDYLLKKFDSIYSSLAAYNAGETVVRDWLNNPKYSYDKIDLYNIPYSETDNYIKKIKNSEKIYHDFYKLK
ncbi:MAG: lytic transglycosylase domain-containing protein [Clostridia bacterium]